MAHDQGFKIDLGCLMVIASCRRLWQQEILDHVFASPLDILCKMAPKNVCVTM